MPDTRTAVQDFFHLYNQHANQNEIDALVAQFAATFLVAGPQGASCVRSQDFALVLPKRKQLFDSLGCHSTELVRIEVDPLNERYCIARTGWKMLFANDGPSKEIHVESTFMVDTRTDPFQIVLYLPHQDIMAVLAERGILKS